MEEEEEEAMMQVSPTPMQLLTRARRDAIKDCYDSFKPWTCPGCEDYSQCPMRHQDHAWLETLAMLKQTEATG